MFYLYAGYYEWFVTDTPLPKPYVLDSEHETLDSALNKAQEYYADDHVHVQEGLLPWWDIDDEAKKPFTMHGITFIF